MSTKLFASWRQPICSSPGFSTVRWVGAGYERTARAGLVECTDQRTEVFGCERDDRFKRICRYWFPHLGDDWAPVASISRLQSEIHWPPPGGLVQCCYDSSSVGDSQGSSVYSSSSSSPCGFSKSADCKVKNTSERSPAIIRSRLYQLFLIRWSVRRF